ncbi:MAG TPA: TolC family protein [Desulfobulbus sp.]|nr:TolC family protein [Desulfobulbus sp.]
MKTGSFFLNSAHMLPGPAIILVLLTGCVGTDLNRLAADVPATSSAPYIPQSIQPRPKDIDNKQLPSLDGRSLNLAQCIKIALEQNPQTRETWQRARSAAAGTGQARSLYLPSVDVTAAATRGDPVILDSRQETGTVDTFAAGFGVRYLLFDGGARSAGLSGAESELLEANFQHNATLQDVALKVEESYYQLLAARELKLVAEQTIRQTQYHVDVARARYQNGLVARSDVLKAETEKADADLLMVRARSRVRVVQGQLAGAMGFVPTENFEVTGLPGNPHQRELADVKHLMEDASSRRPELRAALARVESARSNVAAGKARFWPRVTLNTDYGVRDQTFVPERDEWSLGVGITWSLFDGLNREYTIRRAQADLDRSVAEYEKLLRGVELEVWTAYSHLIEADQAIEAAGVLVASAEENARVTEGQYKNGTTSIIEVTDAQTSRTTANVRLVEARLDWYTALAGLERAIGRTLARKSD